MHLNLVGATVKAVWDNLPHHFPLIELDAFVVMPNHVHGIIVITDNPGNYNPNRNNNPNCRGEAFVPGCNNTSPESSSTNASPFPGCNWIQSYSLGSEAGNLEIAITGYEAATIILAQDEFKEEWAEIQNNLGVAYRQRIRGNRAENLDWAIKCFEKALEIRTKEDFPKDWAQTQNNLGNTYCDRIYGDPMENLERGIDAYKAALEVYTSHSQKFLQEWAMTKSNLGAAYQEQMLIRGDGEESLKAAIAAYRVALRVRTRKTLPKQWATTKNNLGNAYLYLKSGNQTQNLKRAISCYKTAMKVRTFEDEEYRKDWAQTITNLGNAYFYLYAITPNQPENLDRAIATYNKALLVYTPKEFPQGWADIQNNLGKAYSERWQIDIAIERFRAALKIYEPSTFPIDCLRVGRNFGNTAFNVWRWAEAIEGYGVAIEAIEQSRDWANSDNRKAEILSADIDVYAGIVKAYINKDQPDKAIEYVERSKARNLVELLANKSLFPKHDFYPNPEAYQTHCDQLDYLRRKIPAKQRELKRLISSRESEERYRNEIERQRQELNHLKQQRDELLEEINQVDSSFTFTQKVAPIPFSDIQALTDENTAIVQWYITGSQILTFIITRHHPHPFVVSSSPEDMKAGVIPLLSLSGYSE
jgi:tetratricopeptide (TPR) repeat protein